MYISYEHTFECLDIRVKVDGVAPLIGGPSSSTLSKKRRTTKKRHVTCDAKRVEGGGWRVA